METTPSVSLNYEEFRGKKIASDEKWGLSPTSRQELLCGFEQAELSYATIALLGAGGIGGEIGEGLARKGVGRLYLYDGDIVEITNLNRQRFFPEDIGNNKAISEAKNLVRECVFSTVLRGYPHMFEEAVRLNLVEPFTTAVVGLDSNGGRKFSAAHFLERNIPAIFTAVSTDALHGYVFVQEPGKACWGCAFPEAVKSDREPCPGSPAVKDILKVMAGIVLFAIDTLLMKARHREWNMTEVFLDGSVPHGSRMVEKRPDCLICGNRNSSGSNGKYLSAS